MKKLTIREVTLCGLLTAIICICAWITIPSAVPFTMQTFGIFTAVLLLGKHGILAVGAYLLTGMVGLPVFSGFQGGIGVLAGPSGGYLWGFLCMAAIYGIASGDGTNRKRRAAALIAGLLVCYAAGTLQYIFVTGMLFSAESTGKALMLCVVPFILPDIGKLCAAIFVSEIINSHLRRI